MKIKAINAYQFINHCKMLYNMLAEDKKQDGLPEIMGAYLYERLHKLEATAHRDQTADCNGELTEAEAAKRDERTRERIKKVFGHMPPGVFINGDPRGYALKIKEKETPKGFYTDMGGYGILAPEF